MKMYILGISTLIIASIICFFQFYKDDFITNEKKKKRIGFIIFFLTIIAIWLGFYFQELDKRDTLKETNSQKVNIESELLSIKKVVTQKSDSIGILMQQISDLEKESFIMNSMTNSIVYSSDKKIDTIGKKIGSIQNAKIKRTVPIKKKDSAKDLLSSSNGHKIIIGCILGDPEGCEFATELQELFNSSGWLVECRQTAIIGEAKGIFVLYKNPKNYPSYLIYVKKFFSLIGMDIKFKKKSELNEDDIEIFIGSNN